MSDDKEVYNGEIMLHDASYVAVASAGPINLAAEISTAEYNLPATELKTWFLIIASLNGEERTEYMFNALDVANRLSIDARKARGSIVSKIFDKLADRDIVIVSDSVNQEGEHSTYKAHFLAEVSYNKKTRFITFSIPPKLHRFLFNLKKNSTLRLDLQVILSLNTNTAIRVYIYLRSLDRLGIHEISIDEFRKNVPFYQSSEFYEYKRRLLLPAVQEIHRHTDYKDFFIEDNGRRGVKATMLHFGFFKEEKADEHLLDDVNPRLRKELESKFSEAVLIVISMAVKQGFNPAYIKDKFDKYSEERILANFKAVFNRIQKDRTRNKLKSPEAYGRYFIPAVEENWAESNYNEYVEKAKNLVENQKIQKRMNDADEINDFKKFSAYAYEKAKDYISNMSFPELHAFIEGHKKDLLSLAKQNRGREFDREKAYKRKKTYREFRLMAQLAATEMMAGKIPMPKPDVML